MNQTESETLQPKLTAAQLALATALEEACSVDVSTLDTGELIRIDEALAAASKAAKDVVSVRLRMKSGRGKDPSREAREKEEKETASSIITHRVFDDVDGKRWHAFAVQSWPGRTKRSALPAAFSRGWLVFESDDELRRFAPVPDKWEELPIARLRELCHVAVSSPRHTRGPEGGLKAD